MSKENSKDIIAEISVVSANSQIEGDSSSIINQTFMNSKDNNTCIKCEKCGIYYLMEFHNDNLYKIDYYCNCSKNTKENSNDESVNSILEKSILNFEYICYCKLCEKDLGKEDIKDHEIHKDKMVYFNTFHVDDDIKNINEILLMIKFLLFYL